MERTYAAQVRGADEIKVCGFVENIRNKSKMAFIVLKDITGKVQITVEKGEDEALDNAVNQITLDSVITVIGKAVESEYVKLGGVEIYPKQIIIESLAAPLPIDREARKGHERSSIDQRIDYRWIDLRTDANQLMFKAQTVMINAMRQFLLERKFMEIHTPKLIGAASESGADVFEVKYFDRKAYLAQSPQFYKQMAMASGFERIFEVGPVFRAEKHNTQRHLNEYTSMDFEMGFIDGFEDIMQMETKVLQNIMAVLKADYAPQLAALHVSVPDVTSIPAVRFDDAKRMVSEKYGRAIRDPFDLKPEEEQLISRLFAEEYGSEFVFVTHYPSKKRPFYAADDPEDPRYTLSFDLLFRGLEVTTGGQRIHDYDTQVAKLIKKGMNPEDFAGYLMIHKYGTCPHGGLGLGLERLTARLLGENNVRETCLFPRDQQRIEP